MGRSTEPIEPIREQPFAWVDGHQRLTPCRSDDPRPGGLLMSVDARGRVVAPIEDAPFGGEVIGWHLLDSEALGVDPVEVRVFWAKEVERRRQEAAARARRRES